MMSLKPYLSIQKRTYYSGDASQTTLYIGINVLVPDGYVLYLRHPESGNTTAAVCNIYLELLRATSHQHTSPQDYLIGLDKSQWPALTSVAVKVVYHKNKAQGGLHNPNQPISEDQVLCVGSARAEYATAGDLLNEEGLIEVPGYDISSMNARAIPPSNGYDTTLDDPMPILTRLNKKHANIGKAVGAKDPVEGGN
ncbi:MAG: hypothetical protein R3D00_12400 [Bacteroidia bacterium]